MISDQANLPNEIIIRPAKGWVSLYLPDLWHYRELLYFLVWRDIKVRYKQTVLGAAWAILQPLLTMLIFSLIFGTLIGLPSENVPYPVFTYTALLPWQLFAYALTRSSTSLVNSQHLFTKIYFPRLVIPISSVIAGLMDFAIAFLVLMGMILVYGIPITWRILTLPLFIVLAITTALAVGFWLSALNVKYRDVQHTIPFLTQFWMYATPIAYSISIIPERWRLVIGDHYFYSGGCIPVHWWIIVFQTHGRRICGRSLIMSGVIRVENLSKRYTIGRKAEQYGSLRESLTQAVTRPINRLLHRKTGDRQSNTIWALKDVSFEVKRSEVVGIIGRNGAGKTTLLKILSRITKPTAGHAVIRGRVGSLLEVGTGFHPELTGRENIYLNGAILGMRRMEIDRRFDEIVDFSEIEKFLDTPVKRYSSGMYVRLAFAVAAHLEPEILLVDEVLAVGDASFQKKCLGKMRNVAREGRTVLFVSHNMVAIKRLCHRAILLRKGSIYLDDEVIPVINKYLDRKKGISSAEKLWQTINEAPGNDFIRLHSVRLRNIERKITDEIFSHEPFDIEIEYWNLVEGLKIGTTVVIYNNEGICILGSMSNHDIEWHGKPRNSGLYRSICHVPANFFPECEITISVLIWGENYTWSYRENDILHASIYENKLSVRGDYVGGMDGLVRPLFNWRTELIRTDLEKKDVLRSC
jgi:lipopolysaccharide transport system ATP-binding protein